MLFVALLLLVRFFESENPRTLMAAGVVYGLGVLCKQDYGAVVLVVAGVSLVVYGRSRTGSVRVPLAGLFARFLGPAAVVGLLTGGYALYHGFLEHLVRSTVVNHFIGMATFEEYPEFPTLLPLLAQDPMLRTDAGTVFYLPAIVIEADWQRFNDSYLFRDTYVWDVVLKGFYYLPFLMLAAGLVRLVRRRGAASELTSRNRHLSEVVLFSLAAALFCWAHLYRPRDYVHMVVLYWPLLCLAVLYAYELMRARPAIARALIGVAAVPAILWLGYTGRLIVLLREIHDTPIPLARAGVYVSEDQARTFAEVVEYVQEQTTPQQPVAILPYATLLHFLADRRGPDRFSYILWPVADTPDRDRLIIESFERSDVDLVIYDFSYFPHFPRVRDYAPELFTCLVENFEMGPVFSANAYWPRKFTAAHRRRESPPGEPLFDERFTHAQLFVESESFPIEPISPGERASYVEHDLWPFRRVVALRPRAGERQTTLSIDLVPTAGSRLETAIGVKPALWDKLPPSWVEYTVSVRHRGERDVLFQRTLDTARDYLERRWFDVSVPLGDYAGEKISLELATSCERESAERLFMGGWSEPRVVVGPAGESAPVTRDRRSTANNEHEMPLIASAGHEAANHPSRRTGLCDNHACDSGGRRLRDSAK